MKDDQGLDASISWEIFATAFERLDLEIDN